MSPKKTAAKKVEDQVVKFRSRKECDVQVRSERQGKILLALTQLLSLYHLDAQAGVNACSVVALDVIEKALKEIRERALEDSQEYFECIHALAAELDKQFAEAEAEQAEVKTAKAG